MVTRELPPDEWGRLTETDVAPFLAMMNPASVKVFVVEHEGRIIGTWALVQMWHAEGCWIHPDYRQKGTVAARLLSALRTGAADAQELTLLTAAESDDVRGWLERLGAVPSALTLFAWPQDATQGAYTSEDSLCLPRS